MIRSARNCLGAVITAAILATPMSLLAQHYVDLRIFGAGNSSCGAWTEERRNDSALANGYILWIEGFVTATELSHPSIVPAAKQIDSDAIAGWVDNWCAAHPLDKISNAANALTVTLRDRSER
jgi:hypothetical protein